MRITIDTRDAQKQLRSMERQIPFAQAAAVNDLAFQVQRAENEAMGKVFHKPRPFTQKATAVKKGSKAKPVATVYLKAAQERYLEPYEILACSSGPFVASQAAGVGSRATTCGC